MPTALITISRNVSSPLKSKIRLTLENVSACWLSSETCLHSNFDFNLVIAISTVVESLRGSLYNQTTVVVVRYYTVRRPGLSFQWKLRKYAASFLAVGNHFS